MKSPEKNIGKYNLRRNISVLGAALLAIGIGLVRHPNFAAGSNSERTHGISAKSDPQRVEGEVRKKIFVAVGNAVPGGNVAVKAPERDSENPPPDTESPPDENEISLDLLEDAQTEIAKNMSYDENYYKKLAHAFPDGIQMDEWDVEQGRVIKALEEANQFGAQVIDDDGSMFMQIGKGKNWSYGNVYPNPEDGTVNVYLGDLGFEIGAGGVEPFNLPAVLGKVDFYESWYEDELSKLIEDNGDRGFDDEYYNKRDDLISWFVKKMSQDLKGQARLVIGK